MAETKPQNGPEPPSWFKVGALSAASAVVGGLAAAWYYRKTLTRLRQAETSPQSAGPGLPPSEVGEDLL
ncbi:MAG: hypothetical protein ACLPH3_15885 [Terracidiphilus sp.]